MFRFFLAASLLFPLTLHAAPDCSRAAGSLPRPNVPAGTPDPSIPVEHVLVIMQENHSFDNYFGALTKPAHYGAAIDGIRPELSNPNSRGEPVKVYKESQLCVKDLGHGWNAMHGNWNRGANDGFVKTNDKNGDGARAMGYYDETDLPFYYALADQFTVADRYFASAMTQTFPNRFYLLTGTSFGQIQNLLPGAKDRYAQKTIFDLLDQYGISWKYYNDGEGYLKLFQPLYLRSLGRMKTIADYEADLANGTLPQVAFLDTSAEGQDEHPNADIQFGEIWVSQRVRSLIASAAWKSSALFLTYDEGGGFYDHVPPPEACVPDSIEPLLGPDSVPGRFDRYGFRVPFVAVSPFAKHHYVSHAVYDHSSILKFIEAKWNLPALTARDANADGLTDVFDFGHPVFTVSSLPEAVPDPLRVCNEGSPLGIPLHAVSVVSKKNGLCLALSGGNPVFQACDGSASQQFRMDKDLFRTYRLSNPASGLCLEADWSMNRVASAPCRDDEDQGFGVWAGNGERTVEFGGWHGDFCFTAGPAGSSLGFSTCNTSDSVIDFYLQ